jgi:hypothetical protein
MDNKPSVKASIEYVASVLGVSSFMAPRGGFAPLERSVIEEEIFAARSENVGGTFQLPADVAYEGEIGSRLVFVANKEALDANGRDLFERMVKAMKKDPAQVLLLPLDLGQGPHAMEILKAHPRDAIVAYGLETAERLAVDSEWLLARWTEPQPNIPVIATHSLPDILARPELKKIVWQHLQMAMQRLT